MARTLRPGDIARIRYSQELVTVQHVVGAHVLTHCNRRVALADLSLMQTGAMSRGMH